jgi:hypothetical protein
MVLKLGGWARDLEILTGKISYEMLKRASKLDGLFIMTG